MEKTGLLMVALASAAALTGAPSEIAIASEACIPLRFEPGGTSAVVRGAVPPAHAADPSPSGVCYAIDVGEGQLARVRLRSDGSDVGVTIPGVGDMREDFEFKTRRGEYRLEIRQLFPSVTEASFEMRVDVLP